MPIFIYNDANIRMVLNALVLDILILQFSPRNNATAICVTGGNLMLNHTVEC